MEKLGCVIGIIIFLGVTMFVMLTDAGTMNHTVSFSNTNLALNVKNDIQGENQNVVVNAENAKVISKNVNTKSIDINTELKELDNSNIHYNSAGADLRHKSGISSSEVRSLQQGLNASHRTEFSKVPSAINDGRLNNRNVRGNKPDRFGVQNIDWSLWKSNFINRIMDDSISIPELGNYPRGTMYHYSFTVDSTGRVYNVKVRSLTISREDREKIADLIRSYSYKEITRFPANSHRSTVNISSITIFSDETEYSSPDDIHDLEQIRVRL